MTAYQNALGGGMLEVYRTTARLETDGNPELIDKAKELKILFVVIWAYLLTFRCKQTCNSVLKILFVVEVKFRETKFVRGATCRSFPISQKSEGKKVLRIFFRGLGG